MRKFPIALAGLMAVLAGCGTPDVLPDEDLVDFEAVYGVVQVEDYVESYEIGQGEDIYLNLNTSELGTDITRPIAKTIEWPDISTATGETYHRGRLTVDHITREDSDHMYGVRVRLRNTSPHLLTMEYLIRFFARVPGQNLDPIEMEDGTYTRPRLVLTPIAGWNGHNGEEDRWTSILIEPYMTSVLSDFSRIMGAEGFQLLVRGRGSSLDGTPDIQVAPEGEELEEGDFDEAMDVLEGLDSP